MEAQESEIGPLPDRSITGVAEPKSKYDPCPIGHADLEASRRDLEHRLSGPAVPGDIAPQSSSGTDQLSKLCSKCRGLLDTWPKATDLDSRSSRGVIFGRHHETVLDLQKAADEGCSLCSQLRRSVMGKDKAWTEACEWLEACLTCGCKPAASHATAAHNYGYEDDHVEENLRITLSIEFRFPDCYYDEREDRMPDNASFSDVTFHVVMDKSPLVHDAFETFRSLDINTRSSGALINQWLQNCLLNHPACCSQPTDYLPSRIIYLGGLHPVLHDAGQIQGFPPYATLSHCWGNLKLKTLRLDTLVEFHHKIPLDAISQTFADTFSLLAQTGIQYVWIDSLCIIQDDVADWRHESVQMSKVYGKSSLNIAATSASDGTGGLFNERLPSTRCRVTIPSYSQTVLECLPSSHYSRSFEYMPLLTRGWTMQERLLPTRTVQFTSTEVFWECFSTIACESSPSKYRLTMHDYQRNRDRVILKKKRVNRTIWNSIIEQYSMMKLTFQNDKLVALSGISKLIHEETGTRYFAGLWEDTLVLDLLWMSQPNRELEPQVYCAPSWSWASVGSKTWATELRTVSTPQCLVEVVSVDIEPPGSFGTISSGRLQLRCRSMFRVFLEEDQHHENTQNFSVRIFPQVGLRLFYDYPAEILVPFKQAFFLVPLFANSKGLLEGLALRALGGPEKGEGLGKYERVGYITNFQYRDENLGESKDEDTDESEDEDIVSSNYESPNDSNNEEVDFNDVNTTKSKDEENEKKPRCVLDWVSSLWTHPDVETPPIAPEDFVCTEWKDGHEWGVIEIY